MAIDPPASGTTNPTASMRLVTTWPALTRALGDKQNPVRRFIDNRYSHTREMQRRYRHEVGPLVVDGAADAGTLGAAFDWMTRFLIHPCPDLSLAARGATGLPALEKALADLALLLGYQRDGNGKSVMVHRFEGPTSGSTADPVLLARACWALALITERYRAGLLPGSPLANLDLRRHVNAEQLLNLAPQHGINQLLALRDHTRKTLLPALASRPGAWAVGPTFAGSRLMAADADLIAAGLLLELKTNLSDKLRDGTRRASLEGQTIKQLVGYLLLDLADEYAVTHIGVYNARYAHLAQWPVPEFLNDLAGRHVELVEERAAFGELLLSGVRIRPE